MRGTAALHHYSPSNTYTDTVACSSSAPAGTIRENNLTQQCAVGFKSLNSHVESLCYIPQHQLCPTYLAIMFYYMFQVTTCSKPWQHTVLVKYLQQPQSQANVARRVVAGTVLGRFHAGTGEPSRCNIIVGMLSLHKGLSKSSELVGIGCRDFTLQIASPVKKSFYRCLSGWLFSSMYLTRRKGINHKQIYTSISVQKARATPHFFIFWIFGARLLFNLLKWSSAMVLRAV